MLRVFKIINPRSSEGKIPFVGIDNRFKFELIFQPSRNWKTGHRQPFGLYIHVPFFFMRWGCV